MSPSFIPVNLWGLVCHLTPPSSHFMDGGHRQWWRHSVGDESDKWSCWLLDSIQVDFVVDVQFSSVVHFVSRWRPLLGHFLVYAWNIQWACPQTHTLNVCVTCYFLFFCPLGHSRDCPVSFHIVSHYTPTPTVHVLFCFETLAMD